jgi:hypothetical protein
MLPSRFLRAKQALNQKAHAGSGRESEGVPLSFTPKQAVCNPPKNKVCPLVPLPLFPSQEQSVSPCSPPLFPSPKTSRLRPTQQQSVSFCSPSVPLPVPLPKQAVCNPPKNKVCPPVPLPCSPPSVPLPVPLPKQAVRNPPKNKVCPPVPLPLPCSPPPLGPSKCVPPFPSPELKNQLSPQFQKVKSPFFRSIW